MAIRLINAKTKSGLNTKTDVKDTDIAFVSENGYEEIKTQGKDFLFVPSGYEGGNGLFLQSDGTKPIWKTYSPPVVYKWYGVRWSTTYKDPTLERIGNFDYHRELPIQSQIKACIVQSTKSSKTKMYDLDPKDWRFRKNATEIKGTGEITYSNGTASGQVSVNIKNFSDISNLEQAENRLVDHWIQIKDNFDTKQPFKITEVVILDSATTSDKFIRMNVEASLETSGVFNTPFTCYLGSDLSGYDGQVMLDIPQYYILSETNVEDGDNTYNQVKIAQENLGNEWTLVSSRYDSAYRLTVLNTVPKNMGYLSTLPVNSAVSINNTSTYCRGGGNRTDYDKYLKTDPYRSDLGKCRTSINRNIMRTYCRNAGMEIMSYYNYKDIVWLWVIEYATFNSQADFKSTLTAGGLHQGGMGLGVATVNNAVSYNNYYSVCPNGYLDDLGSTTNIKKLELPAFTVSTQKVYFGNRDAIGQYYHQPSVTSKILIDSSSSWKVSSDGQSVTCTNVYGPNAYWSYSAIYGSGEATFHVTGLVDDQKVIIQESSTNKITFTKDNQETPQTITLNGFRIQIEGFTYIKDAGGYNIVDPDKTSCNITVFCDSSTTTELSYPADTEYPFKWRGYENLFGDVSLNLDGIVIDASNESGGSYNTVYATRDPDKYCKSDGSEHDRTSMKTMDQVGKELHQAGYSTQMDLGSEGNIFPIDIKGSTTTGLCDYHYVGTADEDLRSCQVGGYVNSWSPAGLFRFYSNDSLLVSWSLIGFRSSIFK